MHLQNLLWNSLNEDNKVSLFVRYIDIATGKYETAIVNKNQLRKENLKMKELQLKYGCNPNQKPSRIYMEDNGELPIKVIKRKTGIY